MVLLDINMPKKTGLEVLTEIKADLRFRALPVVMLTVSERDEDIIRSFEQGACSYIRKPVTFTQIYHGRQRIRNVLDAGIKNSRAKEVTRACVADRR